MNDDHPQKDNIVYGDDLPHPDLPTAEWHQMGNMVYMLLVGAPWGDIYENVTAHFDEHGDNREFVYIAAILKEMQQIVLEQYENADEEDVYKLEVMKNVTAQVGPRGVLKTFW